MEQMVNTKYKIICKHLYTADKKGHFYTDAVLFMSEGKIDWVGERRDAPQELLRDGYMEYDASDRIAMPGLINGHGHSNLNSYRAISDAEDFTQWAEELAPYTSTLTKEDIEKNNEMSVCEMLKGGTTCICDCTRYEAGLMADACSRAGMRCLAGGMANSPEYRKNGKPNYDSIVDSTRLYKEKYQKDNRIQFFLGAHATYSCTERMIKQTYEKSKMIGKRFIIHAAETLDEEMTIKARTGMRPIQWLADLGVLSPRTVLIHCVQMNDEDIAILRRTGSNVIHCPVSNAKLGNGISPVKKMLENGINVGLGTDSMLSNNTLDMFQEIKMAALASRLKGKDQALSNEKLVKMATSECAKVLGMGNIGVLEQGAAADVLLVKPWHPLGYNKERFLSDVVFYMDRSSVDSIFIDGNLVYTEGKVIKEDETLMKKAIMDHYRRKVL